MKLLLDEMIAAAVAEQLQRRGRDVVATVALAERRGLSDPELFAMAQEDGRAIVTYNRDDFLALDRAFRADNRSHFGVVIVNPRRYPQGRASIGPLVTALELLITAGSPYASFVHWLR